MYDYRASLQGLSERIRAMREEMRETEWRPTEEEEQLRSVATDLERMADRIGTDPLLRLKRTFDAGETGETGPDGQPGAPREPRTGRFEVLRMQMRALAETARMEAESMIDPRRREYLDFCADVFLHIRYECEIPRPDLSDKSDAVADFASVCERAGVMLSRKRLRELLDDALRRFDSCEIPDGLARILVLRA